MNRFHPSAISALLWRNFFATFVQYFSKDETFFTGDDTFFPKTEDKNLCYSGIEHKGGWIR